ncbi:pentatricopeptide repeat-containing protein At3g48810-like [Malus sylvestris]|uniref:pentatricopeptide repeat-containing protein At3g48810-like n=1 Tax=Malus sylvestris TaxID=3752 RepID=UPI0021AD2E94|nr:pentatricopeptide repeat-containing protein At3g48810-like [Malus sylvestris]
MGMEPNVYAYNILLKAMCKNDGVDGARNCLVEMSKKGCLPDAVSYTTVVSVLAQMFVRGCSPNVHTYAFLIKGCFVEGRVHESLDLRKRMICEGFRPNIVPLLAALQLYNMMNRGCRPNVFLDGLFKANRFEEAYGIVREIKEMRMGLNLETYNTTLNGFSSGWNAKEAMQILGKMLRSSYAHSLLSEVKHTVNALVPLGGPGRLVALDEYTRRLALPDVRLVGGGKLALASSGPASTYDQKPCHE